MVSKPIMTVCCIRDNVIDFAVCRSMVVRNTVAVPVTLAVMGGGAVLAGTGMACLGVVTTCKVAESGCSLLRNVFGCRGR